MAPKHSKASRRNLQAVADITSAPPPALEANQIIAKVIKATGNNLYSLRTDTNEEILAELPSKFRSTIWLRRGGYVVVDRHAFDERENKIDGEIVNVVREEKDWRKKSYWPEGFHAAEVEDEEDEEEESLVGKMPPTSDSDDER